MHVNALVIPSEDTCVQEDESLNRSFTTDTNLEKVFGSQSVTDGDSLKAKNSLRRFPRVNANLIGLNSEVRVPCEGANSVAIQLGGTWVGTQTFEGSIDGGDFYAVHTAPIGGAVAVSSATANGWWTINCSGMAYVRVRFSAYTSGTTRVTLVADAAQPMNVAFPATQVTTSTNLDTAIGSIALFQPALTELKQQKVNPVVNPTQPTSYADPKFANWPQRYRRLRVQIGADQDLPLAQEENTNRLIVSTPELRSLIEELLMQQILTNQLLAKAFNLSLPSGMAQEII